MVLSVLELGLLKFRGRVGRNVAMVEDVQVGNLLMDDHHFNHVGVAQRL